MKRALEPYENIVLLLPSPDRDESFRSSDDKSAHWGTLHFRRTNRFTPIPKGAFFMRYRPLLRLAAVGIAALGLATASRAQVVGYTLVIGGNTNAPTLTLTNDAAGGITLTSIVLTIGDTTRNFDAILNENVGATGIAFTRIAPSDGDGGLRSDFLEYTFTGFDSSETFQFDADVDIDNSNTIEDYRVVLFNNGAAANAVLTVNFGNGNTLTQTVADQTPGLSAYTFSQSAVAPEPGTLALLGLGALPIASMVIRRRSGR